jgi:predicted hydrocarbon binding protein
MGFRVTMSFEQAALKIERPGEFEELTRACGRALAPDKAERFLALVAEHRLRVRNFEDVLALGIFDRIDQVEGRPPCRDLYGALGPSDQAQVREFYLSRVEEFDSSLRTKFKQLYQYY